jgi:S1-C subfamily serine protease
VGAGALRWVVLRAGSLVAAGAAGAGIAVGVVAAAGGLSGGSATIRELLPAGDGQLGSEPASFARSAAPLTIHEIYSRAAPGVVQVAATQRVSAAADPFSDPFGFVGPQPRTQQVLGSGFVIDKAGHIVTNFHVVEGATRVEVSFSNDERLPARVIGRDPSTDTAVLEVKAAARALTPLLLGNSDLVRVGDAVVAIGNPLGEDRSITSGIVSALQRSIVAPNGAPIDHVIQTDAALNHGNSGGPLLNARGEVVGVNSQIETAGGSGNVGIGFSIPINTVKSVVAQLIAKGAVVHPYLGVEARAITPDIARLFRLPVQRGLLVGSVCRPSGAAKAGLHGAREQVTVAGDTWPLGGDILVSADGVTLGSVERLRSRVADRKPGDSLRLGIVRGDKTMTTTVKLGRQPLSPRC